MRKRLVFVIMALVLMLSNCVMLQSERYVQTIRIPLADEHKVAYEPRPKRSPWEVTVETVSIPMIIREVGDSAEGIIKAFTVPISGQNLNTIGITAEHRRFVWWAKEPLPPIESPEMIKLLPEDMQAVFGPEEEESE